MLCADTGPVEATNPPLRHPIPVPTCQPSALAARPTVSSPTATPLPRQRLAQLFEYLKAYSDLRYPPVRDIDGQDRTLWLDALPAHASVELPRELGKDEEGNEDGDVLLTLSRPTLTPCPPPPEAIRDWVKPGWQKWPGSSET